MQVVELQNKINLPDFERVTFIMNKSIRFRVLG